jgi:hypothetical protein
MSDLQKRMGSIPDPARAESSNPLWTAEPPLGQSSPSGTLPSGETAGASRLLSSCPTCGAKKFCWPCIIVCSSLDCDWYEITGDLNDLFNASQTRSAARPMGMNASSSDPSIMSHPDMTRIENAQNSFASGANE